MSRYHWLWDLASLRALERRLAVNFHYEYCRKLGQLGPVEVAWVRNGGERYLEGCAARGQRLGDVKPAVLDKRGGWDAWLVGDEG